MHVKRSLIVNTSLEFETEESEVNRKCHYLGLFLEAEAAALAYNLAVAKYFGNYARLNQLKGEQ